MVTPRTDCEQAGAFTSEPPWDVVHLSPEAAELLDRPEVSAQPLAELSAATATAVESAQRTGRPQVVTQLVQTAGAATVLTTIAARAKDSERAAPRVHGWIVDVSAYLGTPDGTALDGIAVVTRGPVTAVVVAGEFDLSRRTELRAALHAAAATDRDIYLDTRHVRFLEARAVATFDELAAALAPHRRLVVVDPPPVVQLVLSVCGSNGPSRWTTA
jgi:anti-anti-sigma regulatory factor